MNNGENELAQLLERARHQLTQPFAKSQRTLLVLLNLFYLVLVPVFLFSEKVATDRFVPHPALGWVYGLVGTVNLISGVYNVVLLWDWAFLPWLGRLLRIKQTYWFDTYTRWGSVLTVMGMSFCHMIGLGNPSSDAILTDFALGHSLIIISAILIGRPPAFVWTSIVFSLLCYDTFVQRGYDYQYNYLTPAESARYEAAVEQQKPWALSRQEQLRAASLNPPHVSRYFNTWLVFILIAGLTAYFCIGITLNVFKVIPAVTENIREAIDATNHQAMERERKESHAEEQRLLMQQANLNAELKTLKAQINPHFLYNTLNYLYIKSLNISDELAEGILKLADIMRYGMQDSSSRVRLDEEINYMHQFVDLHQLRNSHNLFIDFTVEGDTDDKQIPPFLFIELLENAFKHGKMNEAQDPLIIQILVTDTAISLFIRNRKNRKKRVASNHIGLSNLRRRLELTYDQRYHYQVNQDDDHYQCQLTITL